MFYKFIFVSFHLISKGKIFFSDRDFNQLKDFCSSLISIRRCDTSFIFHLISLQLFFVWSWIYIDFWIILWELLDINILIAKIDALFFSFLLEVKSRELLWFVAKIRLSTFFLMRSFTDTKTWLWDSFRAIFYWRNSGLKVKKYF